MFDDSARKRAILDPEDLEAQRSLIRSMFRSGVGQLRVPSIEDSLRAWIPTRALVDRTPNYGEFRHEDYLIDSFIKETGVIDPLDAENRRKLVAAAASLLDSYGERIPGSESWAGDWLQYVEAGPFRSLAIGYNVIMGVVAQVLFDHNDIMTIVPELNRILTPIPIRSLSRSHSLDENTLSNNFPFGLTEQPMISIFSDHFDNGVFKLGILEFCSLFPTRYDRMSDDGRSTVGDPLYPVRFNFCVRDLRTQLSLETVFAR